MAFHPVTTLSYRQLESLKVLFDQDGVRVADSMSMRATNLELLAKTDVEEAELYQNGHVLVELKCHIKFMPVGSTSKVEDFLRRKNHSPPNEKVPSDFTQ